MSVTPMDAENRLIHKLEDLTDKIGTLNLILTKHDVTMTTLVSRIEDLEFELVPIKKQHLMVEGTVKLIGIMALLITVITGILTFFRP